MSSLLIVVLIALPIAGMTGLAVYLDSMLGTPAEKADVELGRMQAWVQPAGVPGAGMWQAPSDPFYTGYPGNGNGGWQEPGGDVPADPLSALQSLAPGIETLALSSGEVRIDTATGLASVSAWAGPAWDPRFEGRFHVLEGRPPAGSDEIMVTPATLTRIGMPLGGTLTDADTGAAYTITGTIDIAERPDAESAIVFADAARFDYAKWYLPSRSLSWDDVQQLNAQGIAAFSREVVLDPPPFSVDGYEIMSPEQSNFLSMLSLVAGLAAGGAFAGYMVVMLAGAAFAVSARRQQRSLAVAASVGADAGDLRRTVRLQGTVLGSVAGAVGLAVGIGLAALVMRLTDNGSASMFWGFHVPWLVLAGILVFAVLVGTLSALMPARGVAKTDAISALRGARRPQKVRASRPLWGSLLVLVGVALTFVSGLAAAAIAANNSIPWDSTWRWIPTIGIIVGPVLAQLGIVLSGRWLLWLASTALSRLGIAARVASRDAVANGARTVPAFAAIGATVFVGVFAVGMGTMAAGQTARSWTYGAPAGGVSSTLYPRGADPLTPEQADEAAEAAASMLAGVGISTTAVVQRQVEHWNYETESDIPADAQIAIALAPERSLIDPESTMGLMSGELDSRNNNITIVDADDLETVTGVELSAAQRAAYRAGAAFVAEDALVTAGTIDVAAWTERQRIFGGAPGNVFLPRPDAPEADAPLWSRTLDAIVFDAPQQPVSVAIAPETARELGIVAQPWSVFGAPDAPLTTADLDRLFEASGSVGTDTFDLGLQVEFGPPGVGSWLVPLLAVVAVLVLGASAVALGLARFERRPDDATLSAVGGTAGLRRRIGFWQGLVIAGFGTFAGAAAGILPPIGFMLQSQTASQPMMLVDIPWTLLIALAIGLPLLIAIVNWLVPPRRPDLTRRTAIA